MLVEDSIKLLTVCLSSENEDIEFVLFPIKEGLNFNYELKIRSSILAAQNWQRAARY